MLGLKILSILSAVMIHTIILALGKPRQEDCHNFKASMDYIARLCQFSSPLGVGWRDERREKKASQPFSLTFHMLTQKTT